MNAPTSPSPILEILRAHYDTAQFTIQDSEPAASKDDGRNINGYWIEARQYLSVEEVAECLVAEFDLEAYTDAVQLALDDKVLDLYESIAIERQEVDDLQSASNINNEGFASQIAYLLSKLGLGETHRILEEIVHAHANNPVSRDVVP